MEEWVSVLKLSTVWEMHKVDLAHVPETLQRS